MMHLTRQGDAVLTLKPMSAPTRLGDFCELTKLRITAVVVVTGYIGFALGEHVAAAPHPWWRLLAMLVGVALSCMGAGALNQLYETDTDARMQRTRNRPLPAGRMTPTAALAIGAALALTGVTVLAVWTSMLAAALSAATVLGYVLVYTPMKRRTHLATIVGAAPGALPPLIGYTAATGRFDALSASIFTIMFVWQLPHFLAIAWLYRDEFANAGFPLLPVLEKSGAATFRQILIGCLALTPLSLLPTALGYAGALYLGAALMLGLAQLAMALRLAKTKSREDARRLFLATLVYITALLVFLLIDVV